MDDKSEASIRGTRPIAVLPCEDSGEHAERNRSRLDMPRSHAAALGAETLRILAEGKYQAPSGRIVPIADDVRRAVAAKVSLPPDAALPAPAVASMALPESPPLTIQVRNETTLDAGERLHREGKRPLALNFAAPRHPGGGFLDGARAQEENLARSSGLFATLEGDPMYDHHRDDHSPLASDWTILSPDVPVFRTDGGTLREETWPLSIITCAAPKADRADIGIAAATAYLKPRIGRVLSVARAYDYRTLILGAWGCGAFHCDGDLVAGYFRDALLGPDFRGAFDEVVFAITDWSPERRMLGPFRDTFATVATGWRRYGS